MKLCTKRQVGMAAALLLTAGVLTACSSTAPGGGTAPSNDASHAKIGLLLPEVTVLRYEEKDRPYFTEALKKMCPDCELLYANASSSAAKQLEQAQSMLTQGVQVLVINPYDAVAAASIVVAAKAQNVPVVSYDRLIQSPDIAFSVTNDYEKVGELQATALVEKLKGDGVATDAGGILMIDGAVTSPNAALMKKGAHKIIDSSGYKVLAEFETYDPAEAQEWVSGQLTKFRDQINGVYSVNDGNAGAAIAAMKAIGLNPIPPITGLDASLAGLQQIVLGNQYMTVYNPFRSEANHAAQAAFDLASGKTPEVTRTLKGIPTFLTQPVAVTADNIMDTIIKDEFYKISEICTSSYATACQAAGIK